jgi:pyruvyltransferase
MFFLKKKRDNINLFYYKPRSFTNFGDSLNVLLIEHLTGRKVIYTNPESADCIGIGSLLDHYIAINENNNFEIPTPLTIWGSGFLANKGEHPLFKTEIKERFTRPVIVKGVRGNATKSRIEEMGYDLSNASMGDPALLLSRIINVKKSVKKYHVGLITHYSDKGNRIIHELIRKIPNALIIDITHNPLDIIRSILECEIILSSAMHGLIVADAFNIPNIHITIDNKLTGGSYKFEDYYSVYNISHKTIKRGELERLNKNKLEFIIEDYKISRESVENICNDLIRTLPWRRKYFSKKIKL